MIETILVGVLFACLFAGISKVVIDWHDSWQFSKWKKRHDSMPIDERIARMKIRVD